jgi:hypothetical protein
VVSRPTFPADDLAEQARYFHHLEWGTSNGYEYTNTRVTEADHPDWVPEAPEGWELNVDRWPTYDEETAFWERVGPGVLRSPRGELVAYWRRKKR